MSAENTMVLYVGDGAVGDELAVTLENLGGYAYVPAEAMEALAMLITYMPNWVVLDANQAPEMAEAFFYHIKDADWYTTPTLILSDKAGRWDILGIKAPIHIVGYVNNPVDFILSTITSKELTHAA